MSSRRARKALIAIANVSQGATILFGVVQEWTLAGLYLAVHIAALQCAKRLDRRAA